MDIQRKSRSEKVLRGFIALLLLVWVMINIMLLFGVQTRDLLGTMFAFSWQAFLSIGISVVVFAFSRILVGKIAKGIVIAAGILSCMCIIKNLFIILLTGEAVIALIDSVACIGIIGCALFGYASIGKKHMRIPQGICAMICFSCVLMVTVIEWGFGTIAYFCSMTESVVFLLWLGEKEPLNRNRKMDWGSELRSGGMSVVEYGGVVCLIMILFGFFLPFHLTEKAGCLVKAVTEASARFKNGEFLYGGWMIVCLAVFVIGYLGLWIAWRTTVNYIGYQKYGYSIFLAGGSFVAFVMFLGITDLEKCIGIDIRLLLADKGLFLLITGYFCLTVFAGISILIKKSYNDKIKNMRTKE